MNELRGIRLYIDTSVYGGCFDNGFSAESLKVFELVDRWQATVLVSGVIEFELQAAPARVRAVCSSINPLQVERCATNDRMREIAFEYIARGLFPRRSVADATHVAAATLMNADVIVSWNFKHLVNVAKVHRICQVNAELGLPSIDIRSPLEFASDER